MNIPCRSSPRTGSSRASNDAVRLISTTRMQTSTCKAPGTEQTHETTTTWLVLLVCIETHNTSESSLAAGCWAHADRVQRAREAAHRHRHGAKPLAHDQQSPHVAEQRAGRCDLLMRQHSDVLRGFVPCMSWQLDGHGMPWYAPGYLTVTTPTAGPLRSSCDTHPCSCPPRPVLRSLLSPSRHHF